MPEIYFTVQKTIGTLSSTNSANHGKWCKELNIVSWNGREAKFDIRDWNETHEKMGRGVSLTTEEARALRDLLNAINFEE